METRVVNQIVPAPAQTNVGALTPRDMTGAMALANMMCSAKLVPPHLQKSAGDCLLVIEQAMRWGMSPFAVAQCTSVIHGRLMFQGQLVSAALHTSGILTSRLSYEFKGDGNEREITILGTLRGEATARSIAIKLKDARTDNAMWTKQPDQQLVYFATRAWARRHAPEVMLGVYAPEDFPVGPAQAQDNFDGTTIEGSSDTGEAINDSLPEHSAPPPVAKQEPYKATDEELIARLTALLAKAETMEEWNKITAYPSAQRLKSQLNTEIQAAYDRINTEAAHEPVENYEWPGAEPETQEAA